MANEDAPPQPPQPDREKIVKSKIIRFLPLLFIAALMIGAYTAGIGEYLTFDELKKHRITLMSLVENHPFLAPLAFIVVYAISTALSIPGGLFLSIFGGFLFPQPFATFYIVTGATLGATGIFLAAKTAFGDFLRERAGPLLNKMQSGFQENASSYLLFLRLVPLFPFWLVNLAPAFFGVPLRTYVWTTFLGIIPGAFVFAQAGAGLGSIFDSAETFSVEAIFTWDVRIALIALGIFALLPAVIKKFRKNNKDD